MDSLFFIINPVAGGGRAKKMVPIIERYMKDINREYSIALTTGPKEATNITKESIAKGYRTIVAVGGDGTVNEVALGILEFGEGSLGIIPSGTGNDLARTLNIPFNPEEAIDTIIKGNLKNIDLGIVNNKMFLNIASIGFDAEVVRNTDKIKKRIKSGIAYVFGVLVTLFKFKEIKVELNIDQVSLSKDIYLVAVGNGNYYGGGLKILPMSSVEDGYFHICVINKVPKLKLLFLFPTILKGNHIKYKKYVEVFKAKTIKVITEDKTYLNIDGEIKNIDKEIVFNISNEKLSVFVKK